MTRFLNAALYSFIFLCMAVPAIAQTGPTARNALAVVVDPLTLERTGILNDPGVLELHVVLLDFDGLSWDGVQSLQFGLELDPRLEFLGQTYATWAEVAINPAPGEYVLGGSTCLVREDLPHALMTFYVRPAAGTVDLSDLRVDVRDLTTRGEPMAVARCLAGTWVEPLVNGGGVVLNPTAPQVVNLIATPVPVVEGREYDLLWNTWGGDPGAVLLDGISVAADDGRTLSASVGTRHELQVSGAGSTATSTLELDVIREPRVSFFTSEILESGGNVQTRLAWRVAGANLIQLDGEGSLAPIGSKIVPLSDTDVYELVATNEWGTTSRIAGPPIPAESAPIIHHLRASPSTFAPGQDVVLHYGVYNADTVEITPEVGIVDPVGGEVVVQPTSATTYTMTAINAYGSTERSVEVVPGPPVIQLFSIDPIRFIRTEDVTVRWRVLGAEQVEVTGGLGVVAPDSGEVTHEFSETGWVTLTATNAHGTSTRSVETLLVEPRIVTFQPAGVTYPGQATTLLYSFTLGMTGEIQPGVGPVLGNQGHVQVLTTEPNTEFTLFASAGDTTVSATTAILWSPPGVSITSSSTNPKVGQPFTLSVTAHHADSLRVDPGVGWIDPSGETVGVSVIGPTEFVATAYNRGGVATDSVVITPRVVPVGLTLTTSDPSPMPGANFTLTASATNADSLWLEPGFGLIDPEGGTFTTSVTDTTTFVLTGKNLGNTETLELVIRPAAPTAFLIAVTPVIGPGESATLRVSTSRADSIRLDPVFGRIVGTGDYATVLQETTEFVLSASNALYTVRDTVVVEVRPPLVKRFRAAPSSMLDGEVSTLSWSVRWAETVSIAGSDGSTWTGLAGEGSLEVDPSVTTEYVLTASNSIGEVSASIQVEIVPFAIRVFRSSPPSGVAGSAFTLDWEVVGTPTSVRLVGYGEQPLVGSMQLVLEETTTFELVATDGVYETRRVIEVVVVPPTGVKKLALSWAPDRYEGFATRNLADFQIEDLYLVVSGVIEGMLAFETQVVIPPGTILMVDEYVNMPRPINLGTLPNFIVGTGACLYQNADEWWPLLRLRVFGFNTLPDDYTFQLAPSEPSSFGGLSSGYSNCANVVIPFAETLGARYVSGTIVPTVNIALESQWLDGGLRLRWGDEHLALVPETVHVERSVDGAPFSLAAILVDPDVLARREWMDPEASGLDASGKGLRYRVQLLRDGHRYSSAEHQVTPGRPSVEMSRLLPNLPNPFNPSTELRWELAKGGDVRLTLYDIAGRRVRGWFLPEQPVGAGTVHWDGTDDDGRGVATGVYIVRMESGGRTDSRRITLLK